MRVYILLKYGSSVAALLSLLLACPVHAARDFTQDTSNYCGVTTSAIENLVNGATDIALAAWLEADSFADIASRNYVTGFLIDSTATLGFNVGVDAPSSGQEVRCEARSVSTDAKQVEYGSSSVSTGSYVLLGCHYDIQGDAIQPYYQGVAEDDGDTSRAFANTTWTKGTVTGAAAIGANRAPPGTASAPTDGRVAHVGVWVTTDGSPPLTTAEWAALGKGMDMRLAAPHNLIEYWQVTGRDSPETGLINNTSCTITGTLNFGINPGIYHAN